MESVKNFKIPIYTVLFFILFASSAQAVRLVVDSTSHIFLHVGAAILLYAHIFSGAIGLVSGVLATISRKGAKLHRMAGKFFSVSMLICYFIGAVVSPFLPEGQRPNFVAAVLALYLLISGVIAARKKPFKGGLAEKIGLVVALLISASGVLFFIIGQNSETGTVDGSPPQAFIIFVIAGTLAALGELRIIVKKEISNKSRVIRHLWRMCFSFFFASASLFLGQPQIFTTEFNQSIWPAVLAFYPLMIAVIWLIKTHFARRS